MSFGLMSYFLFLNLTTASVWRSDDISIFGQSLIQGLEGRKKCVRRGEGEGALC